MEVLDSIKRYVPYNEQEARDKEVFMQSFRVFEDILTRKNKIAHLTSSAFVVNKARDKVLVVHHNIYNSWSWIGGHADGEEDLLSVAVKELIEETGAKTIAPITSEIFSLDVLPVFGHIKQGEYISSHLHLSVAYLVEGDESDCLRIKKNENSGVKWIPLKALNSYSSEIHMHKVYEKLINKLRSLSL